MLILITSVALVVVLGIAWVRARGRAKRAESALRELQSAAARAAAAPDADMRHAIEAIAIEVERIGEGQRFMTGVLAKRPMNAEQKRSTP